MNVSWVPLYSNSLHWTVSDRFIDHTTTVFIPVECIQGIRLYLVLNPTVSYLTVSYMSRQLYPLYQLYPIPLHRALYTRHEQTIVYTVSTVSYLTATCIVSKAWSDHKGFDVGGQEAHHLPTTTNQTLAPKDKGLISISRLFCMGILSCDTWRCNMCKAPSQVPRLT